MYDAGPAVLRGAVIVAARIIGLALALTSLLVLAMALTRLFVHPLARVPGPRLAAVTNLWHAHYARNGRMLELATTLHQEYGPVVRVGPNEVWLNSKEAFRAIYNPSSGFEKSDFYLATALQRPRLEWGFPPRVATPDTLDLLSERDMRRYRLQRRLIGPLYRPANVQKLEGAVDAVIRQAVRRIRALHGAEVDLKEWMHIIAVECLGAAVLSWSPGLLRAGSDGGTGAQSYLTWRSKSVLGLFPLLVLIESYVKSLGRLFRVVLRVTHRMPKGLKPFFIGVQEKVRKRVKARPGRVRGQGRRQDLLDDLIQLRASRPEFTDTYLRRMAMTNFGAGHETMTSALTAALALIGTHPPVQHRVAAEIHGTPDTITWEDAQRLTYTVACIQEAQRLHPAIGMSLPRTVPQEGFWLHGHFFPPGTTVGCNPLALHRNPDIFGEDADSFSPDRWLAADENMRRALRQYNLTWGGGARMCPGRRLAEMIIQKLVRALLREFELEVVMPKKEDIRYYFVAILTGVRVRFVPRAEIAHTG